MITQSLNQSVCQSVRNSIWLLNIWKEPTTYFTEATFTNDTLELEVDTAQMRYKKQDKIGQSFNEVLN